jgi:hypothetical protein
MALPFRDVEDAVGTFGLLGAFRFLLAQFGERGDVGDDAMLSLGGMAALTGVFAAAAEAVVAALDAERLADTAAALVGLRVLAVEMLQRARAHRKAFGPASGNAVERALGDIETSLSVARGPRLVRQARLGAQLTADRRRSGDAS